MITEMQKFWSLMQAAEEANRVYQDMAPDRMNTPTDDVIAEKVTDKATKAFEALKESFPLTVPNDFTWHAMSHVGIEEIITELQNRDRALPIKLRLELQAVAKGGDKFRGLNVTTLKRLKRTYRMATYGAGKVKSFIKHLTREEQYRVYQEIQTVLENCTIDEVTMDKRGFVTAHNDKNEKTPIKWQIEGSWSLTIAEWDD